jgi:hypothetical protein
MDKKTSFSATDTKNIPQRREAEKLKVHTCQYCKKEFTGWVSDDLQNTYLICYCPNCHKANHYKYWP